MVRKRTDAQSQNYSLVVNLTKVHRPEELAAKLKTGKVITKEAVIRESKYWPFLGKFKN
jgi:hypothetical protein